MPEFVAAICASDNLSCFFANSLSTYVWDARPLIAVAIAEFIAALAPATWSSTYVIFAYGVRSTSAPSPFGPWGPIGPSGPRGPSGPIGPWGPSGPRSPGAPIISDLEIKFCHAVSPSYFHNRSVSLEPITTSRPSWPAIVPIASLTRSISTVISFVRSSIETKPSDAGVNVSCFLSILSPNAISAFFRFSISRRIALASPGVTPEPPDDVSPVGRLIELPPLTDVPPFKYLPIDKREPVATRPLVVVADEFVEPVDDLSDVGVTRSEPPRTPDAEPLPLPDAAAALLYVPAPPRLRTDDAALATEVAAHSTHTIAHVDIFKSFFITLSTDT